MPRLRDEEALRAVRIANSELERAVAQKSFVVTNIISRANAEQRRIRNE